METILLADYLLLGTEDKIKVLRFLKKTYPDARVSFLLLGRHVPRYLRWFGSMSFMKKYFRFAFLFCKRIAYLCMPGISFIEPNHFRIVFKNGGTCKVVIPYCDNKERIEDLIFEFLHDHEKQCELFFLNKRYELIPQDFSKPALTQVDYHVCWHCNLKCKGCGHLCNLYNSPRMGNLQSFVSDMERMAELFSTIRTIHLMGGEPLLNPELPSYIKEARRIFPFSKIVVYTNGLLIPKADEALWDAIKGNNACFFITCYPPTGVIKEKIIEVCEKEQVAYSFSPEVRFFYRQKRRWQYFDRGESYKRCVYSYCHSLNEGKLSVCSAPIVEEQAKGISHSICRVSSYDTINIYSPEIKSGFDILDRFACPIPFCRFCDTKKGERFRWEGHYSLPIDWR